MLKSRENDAEDEAMKCLKSVLAGVCVDNELAAREDRAPGERPPFGVLEVEAMSRTVSPSSKSRMVWRAWPGCGAWHVPVSMPPGVVSS